MNGDPVQPGFQAAFAIEALHAAKDLQEHFLRGIGRVRRVSEDAVHKAVDGLVIMRDQPVVSLLRPGFQVGDNGGFLSPYADCAGDVTQCCYSRHFSHGDTPFSQDIPAGTTNRDVTAVTITGTAILAMNRPRSGEVSSCSGLNLVRRS